MPVKPAEPTQWFIRLLFLYLSPALVYYVVRLITSWSVFPLLSTTSSSLLACVTSFLLLLLLVIPEYLEYGLSKQPPEFLFIAILELHYLACFFVFLMYEPSKWLLLPLGFLTYPLTHLFMFNQFLTLGLTPAELGYFTTVSLKFKNFLFETSDAARQRDNRFSDGKP